MSLKDKIKAIFKKQKVVINQKSSVNALYTASNHDLKKVADQVNHIQDTLDNLNIPTIPDHSDFAVKSTDNTFSGTNTFTKAVKLETFPEISKGNFEPTLNKQISTKFYVDKKVNDSANTLNQNITTSANACLQESKQYTDEKHDQQQTNINHLNDITAKVTNDNVFTKSNTFEKEVTFKWSTSINSDSIFFKSLPLITTQQNVYSDNQLITKKYVDQEIAKVSGGNNLVFGIKKYELDTTIQKYDLANRIYYYWIKNSSNITVNFGQKYANKKVIIKLYRQYTTSSYFYNGNFTKLIIDTINSSGNLTFTTSNDTTFVCHIDFKPGSVGEFIIKMGYIVEFIIDINGNEVIT